MKEFQFYNFEHCNRLDFYNIDDDTEEIIIALEDLCKPFEKLFDESLHALYQLSWFNIILSNEPFNDAIEIELTEPRKKVFIKLKQPDEIMLNVYIGFTE